MAGDVNDGGRRRLTKADRPVRFLVAGGLNTLVGLSAYPVLLWINPWFHEHYLVALAIVQVLCLLFAFTTYKIGVFRRAAISSASSGDFRLITR